MTWLGVDVGGPRKGFDVALARAVCGIRWTPDRLDGPDYAWVVEGLRLYDALAGRVVIEVFPTASWTRWLGPRGTESRAAWTRRGVAALGLAGVPARTNQDQRDAIAAAMTARAYSYGGTEAFGEIMVPREQDTKRLVRRALEEVYEGGDLTVLDELFHPQYADHEPAHPDHPPGPESVRETVRSLHAAFGDLRFEVHDEIAEGDKVVQRATMSGRHTGVLAGHEPTGREFAVRHVYIWRIADGRIVEHWGSRDDLGLLRQLGLL